MKLSLDGVRVQSETTYVWAGPCVLSVHTVIPQPDLAIERCRALSVRARSRSRARTRVARRASRYARTPARSRPTDLLGLGA